MKFNVFYLNFFIFGFLFLNNFCLCDLPFAVITGTTNYEIGFNIGKLFASRIQGFVKQYSTLQNTLIPFYLSDDGRRTFNLLLQNVQSKFPQYIDEIRGTAAGSGVPEYQLMLLNFEPEITSVKSPNHPFPTELSCSDLHLKTDSLLIDAHNEDSDSSIKPYAYFIEVKPNNSDGSIRAFKAYVYPGYLAG